MSSQLSLASPASYHPRAIELNVQGAEYHDRGDLEAAMFHYRAAYRLDPNFLPPLANMGIVLSGQNQLASAASIFQRLVALCPRDPKMWNCLGVVLIRLERYQEADEALDRAAELDPDTPAVWQNRALSAYWSGRFERALECIDRSQALGGDPAICGNDRAHFLFARGSSLVEALEQYEGRWGLGAGLLPKLRPWEVADECGVPEWKGEDLTGRRILLHYEQGFGDTIMTLRFERQLRARGASVALGVHSSMVRWMRHNDLDAIDSDQISAEAMKSFDFHSPMYSAMRWLGVEWNSIDPEAYLRPGRVSVPPVYGNIFNVGICWASGKRGTELDWRARHSPLDAWLPLCEIPGVCVYSLMFGPEREEIETLGAHALIVDDTVHLDDFAASSAYITQLDLVICVDTAVAHVAGALGKPVWMISQSQPCWRWRTPGTGLPWYSSMRTWVQPQVGDWRTPLNSIYLALQERVR